MLGTYLAEASDVSVDNAGNVQVAIPHHLQRECGRTCMSVDAPSDETHIYARICLYEHLINNLTAYATPE
jgi:hypothetical protein